VARLKIPGRPLRWMVTHVTFVTGQNPAYRLAHRHDQPSFFEVGVEVASNLNQCE